MSTYVWVHGAWFGSWAGAKVAPLLQRAGHKVVAPDWPGHGADRTPVGQLSLKAYADRVIEALDAQHEPAILVGHSAGGAVISLAAEHRPHKVKTLVYLSAYLPRSGEDINSWASQDRQSHIFPSLVISEDQTTAWIKDDAIKDVFMADACDEDVTWAKALMVPEAGRLFTDKVLITEGNFGRIPRVYIQCTQDHAISLPIQQAMYSATPCDKVYSLDASHAPFLSKPIELAEHLLDISAQHFGERTPLMSEHA